MNIILLTVIISSTVAVVHGEPCQAKSDNNAYGRFFNKHILQRSFKRNDPKKWRRYLEGDNPSKTILCGRVKVQSFIDAPERAVQQICGNAGWRVQGRRAGNLCISNSKMQVYDVESKFKNKVCTVTSVTPHQRKVVVACNKVANQCRPVHYEKYKGQKQSQTRCV